MSILKLSKKHYYCLTVGDKNQIAQRMSRDDSRYKNIQLETGYEISKKEMLSEERDNPNTDLKMKMVCIDNFWYNRILINGISKSKVIVYKQKTNDPVLVISDLEKKEFAIIMGLANIKI